MEKTIRVLTAIGIILSGLGELLRQFNISADKVKDEVQKVMKKDELEKSSKTKGESIDS
jgi:hypothetical protein